MHIGKPEREIVALPIKIRKPVKAPKVPAPAR